MSNNPNGLSCRCRGCRGFTLVELLVSMAIMAILFGTMMPLMDKVWLSSENDDTKERILKLKRAMVGDERMVQNGIRMHYGFVGDYGTLPAVLADLIIEPDWVSPGLWQGPYLLGGFDVKDYYNDAWHRELIYTVYPPGSPLKVTYHVEGHPDVVREFAATLTSKGFDGIEGTADDINVNTNPELQILVSEVWPVTSVQGTLDYLFTTTSTTPLTTTFSAKLYVRYAVPTGTDVLFSQCSNELGVGEIVVNEPVRVRPTLTIGDGSVPLLPVGRVTVGSQLFASTNCSGLPEPDLNEVVAYVGEGLTTLAVKLPTLNYQVSP